MKTYIGLANCSRCGGNSPNCYVCNDPEPEEKSKPISVESSIRSYSDETLQGAIESLRKADYLGKWGGDRLALLEAESLRRRIERKNKP